MIKDSVLVVPHLSVLPLRACCKDWFFPSGCTAAILGLWTILIAFDFAKHTLMLGVDPPPPQLDGYEYWRLGGQLASGDWLLQNEKGAFRTPGYPLFLAPFHALFGKLALFATFAGQHLLIMATSLVTAAICGRVSGRSLAAVLGYGLSALCYSRDWHANLVLSETLFTFLLMLAIAALTHFCSRRSLVAAGSIGLLIGLATLVRPISTYLWVPVALVFVLPRFRWWRASDGQLPSWFSVVGQVAVLVAAVYIALAPWLLRNQVLFGSPFMTQFIGRNLWVVTFEDQFGAGLKLGDGPASSELKQRLAEFDGQVIIHDTWSVSDALTATGLPDDEIDALMLRVCRELIAEARPQVAYKTFRRTVNFWRCVSNPFPFYDWNSDQTDYFGQWIWKSPSVTAVYRWANQFAASRSLRLNELAVLGVLLGALRLASRHSTRALAAGFLLTLLYFNAVTAALEVPSYRYRMILEPLMIVVFVSGTALQRKQTKAAESEQKSESPVEQGG